MINKLLLKYVLNYLLDETFRLRRIEYNYKILKDEIKINITIRLNDKLIKKEIYLPHENWVTYIINFDFLKEYIKNEIDKVER